MYSRVNRRASGIFNPGYHKAFNIGWAKSRVFEELGCKKKVALR
jgi:hypothetical protein